MIEMSRPFGSRHFKHFLFEIIHFDANFNFSFGLHFTSFPKSYSYFRCCLECKEIIISGAGSLKKHTNAVHNGQKDHKCDSCAKTLSSVQSLKIHINSVHNDQKDHKCDSCGKSFFGSWVLKRHINEVHESQKDHECGSCGNTFLQQET